MQAGAPTAQHLSYAADWRSKLPETLSVAARDPMSAVALIYALLLSKDDAMRKTQLDQLQTRTEPAICQETARLVSLLSLTLESTARLPLATLYDCALAPPFAGRNTRSSPRTAAITSSRATTSLSCLPYRLFKKSCCANLSRISRRRAERSSQYSRSQTARSR